MFEGKNDLIRQHLTVPFYALAAVEFSFYSQFFGDVGSDRSTEGYANNGYAFPTKNTTNNYVKWRVEDKKTSEQCIADILRQLNRIVLSVWEYSKDTYICIY